MIVKDNFETIGLQSANGSLALAGFVSSKDAFQVKRIKEAGAIVLAKSNMAEWAFTPIRDAELDSSRLHEEPVRARSCHGRIERRYRRVGRGELRRRGPRIRHRQLDSRAVVAPGAGRHSIDDGADEPRGRDAAQPAGRHRRARWRAPSPTPPTIFQVVVGEDPDDPATAAAKGRPRENYSAALVRDGLRGARIGILRQAYERDSTDPEIVQVFMNAVEELRTAGAVIVDPARVEGLESIRRRAGRRPVHGLQVRHQSLLRRRTAIAVPMKSLAEVVKSGRFHPTVQRRLEQAERRS